jgi:hypothetical protein
VTLVRASLLLTYHRLPAMLVLDWRTKRSSSGTYWKVDVSVHLVQLETDRWTPYDSIMKTAARWWPQANPEWSLHMTLVHKQQQHLSQQTTQCLALLSPLITQ